MPLGRPVEHREVDLRDVAAPRFEVLVGEAQLRADVAHRAQGGRVRDVEV